MIYKPQREMKKLERMDGELFRGLKSNEVSNLAAHLGGEVITTSGTQDFQVGNKIYTKNFTDKQKGVCIKGVWYDDGCPYDHVYFRPVVDSGNEDLEMVSSVTVLTINN